MTQNHQEVEIKLAVPSAAAAAELLQRKGFTERTPRSFEANELYDDAAGTLRGRRELIRLREFCGKVILTYKGPPREGPHKNREEVETEVSDRAAFALILGRLGFEKTFRYEKYRRELSRPGEPGIVTLDETPIGDFLELEGPAPWIDQTAAELGFTPASYITLSYGTLYLRHREADASAPADMVFPASA